MAVSPLLLALLICSHLQSLFKYCAVFHLLADISQPQCSYTRAAICLRFRCTAGFVQKKNHAPQVLCKMCLSWHILRSSGFFIRPFSFQNRYFDMQEKSRCTKSNKLWLSYIILLRGAGSFSQSNDLLRMQPSLLLLLVTPVLFLRCQVQMGAGKKALGLSQPAETNSLHLDGIS